MFIKRAHDHLSVGNTPAVITLELPVSGGIFHWGDTINYRVRCLSFYVSSFVDEQLLNESWIPYI